MPRHPGVDARRPQLVNSKIAQKKTPVVVHTTGASTGTVTVKLTSDKGLD